MLCVLILIIESINETCRDVLDLAVVLFIDFYLFVQLIGSDGMMLLYDRKCIINA